MERTTGYPWILFRTLHQGLLFFFFSLFVCFWLHHTAWGNLSSPTSDQTCALCIGSMESWLLHHQGSPKVCLFFFFFIFLLLIPNLGHDDDCHHSFSRQWRRPLLRMLEPMENLVGDIVCILRLIDTLHMSTRKKNRTDFDYHFSCTIGFHD